MSFTQRIHYYWKKIKELDIYNYHTKIEEIKKLEDELEKDNEMLDTDKRFIRVRLIEPIKEELGIK